MSNTDQETLLRTIEDARRILGEYIEPGPRDAQRKPSSVSSPCSTRATSCTLLIELNGEE